MAEIIKDQDYIREATSRLSNLEGVDAAAVREYQEKLAVSVPKPLEAKASLTFVLFYGVVTVNVRSEPYNKCVYDESTWGLGGSAASGLGFMYTAYESWDAFFKNVTAYHVQSIASGGGILQVNWFIKNGTPVGQLNAAVGGLGVLEAGGSGKWKC